MRIPLTKSESIEVTIITTNTTSFMTAIVSTSARLHNEFVRLLFLQAHGETDRFFAASGVPLRILPADSSTSAARHSPHSLNQGSATSLLRLQLYELILILMGLLSLQEHILTHHTRKLLVY
jgi:hypothetical protein